MRIRLNALEANFLWADGTTTWQNPETTLENGLDNELWQMLLRNDSRLREQLDEWRQSLEGSDSDMQLEDWTVITPSQHELTQVDQVRLWKIALQKAIEIDSQKKKAHQIPSMKYQPGYRVRDTACFINDVGRQWKQTMENESGSNFEILLFLESHGQNVPLVQAERLCAPLGSLADIDHLEAISFDLVQTLYQQQHFVACHTQSLQALNGNPRVNKFEIFDDPFIEGAGNVCIKWKRPTCTGQQWLQYVPQNQNVVYPVQTNMYGTQKVLSRMAKPHKALLPLKKLSLGIVGQKAKALHAVKRVLNRHLIGTVDSLQSVATRVETSFTSFNLQNFEGLDKPKDIAEIIKTTAEQSMGPQLFPQLATLTCPIEHWRTVERNFAVRLAADFETFYKDRTRSTEWIGTESYLKILHKTILGAVSEENKWRKMVNIGIGEEVNRGKMKHNKLKNGTLQLPTFQRSSVLLSTKEYLKSTHTKSTFVEHLVVRLRSKMRRLFTDPVPSREGRLRNVQWALSVWNLAMYICKMKSTGRKAEWFAWWLRYFTNMDQDLREVVLLDELPNETMWPTNVKIIGVHEFAELLLRPAPTKDEIRTCRWPNKKVWTVWRATQALLRQSLGRGGENGQINELAALIWSLQNNWFFSPRWTSGNLKRTGIIFVRGSTPYPETQVSQTRSRINQARRNRNRNSSNNESAAATVPVMHDRRLSANISVTSVVAPASAAATNAQVSSASAASAASANIHAAAVPNASAAVPTSTTVQASAIANPVNANSSNVPVNAGPVPTVIPVTMEQIWRKCTKPKSRNGSVIPEIITHFHSFTQNKVHNINQSLGLLQNWKNFWESCYQDFIGIPLYQTYPSEEQAKLRTWKNQSLRRKK